MSRMLEEDLEVRHSPASPAWILTVSNSPIAHVLEAAEIGLFQVDTVTGLANWDKVAGTVLGVGAAQQLSPAPLPIHDEDLTDVRRRLDRISTGGGEKDADLRIVRASGEVRWIKCSARLAPGHKPPGRYVVGVLTDITDRHHQATMLKEATRSVNELLDSLPHIIWSADSAGRSTFLSSQWLDYTGRDPASDVGEGWAAALHPDDRGATLSNWLACVRRISTFEAEFRLLSRSGEYRWHSAKGLPSFNENGELTCWRGTCTDVHDRVVAEHALAESQRLQRTAAERLRSTLDLIPQMVWSMKGSQRFPDFYNRRWYEFTGLPPGSTHGPEWAGLYHSADLDDTLAKWRLCRSSGEPFEACYRIRDRKGEYRWVRSEARTEKDELGRVVRWYGTCTDINESVLQQRTLQESEERAKRILNSVPHVIWTARPDGTLDFLSEQWAKTLESSKPEMRGDEWLSAVHPDDLAKTAAAWQAAISASEPYETEFRIRWGTASYRWILARALPEIDENGATVRWYGTCTDIHDRVIARQALHESERLSRGIIEATADCMSLLDCDGTVLFVNDAVVKAHRANDSSELLGLPWANSFHGGLGARARAELKRAQGGGIGRLTLRGGENGDRWFDVLISPIYNDIGGVTRLLVTSRDVTEQKKAQEEAEWAANHDPLTGLPNRFLAQIVIDKELAKAQSEERSLGLILLDADHLKRVNDGLGHDAGDAMLCEIARRLSATVPDAAVIARLGGDEFAIVDRKISSPAALMQISGRLMKALSEPFSYAGRLVDCHASGGAAMIGAFSRTRAELMKNADIALYAAKSNGRGNTQIFDPSMRLALQRRDSMLNLASDALNEDRILPHYQPKVDLRTGAVAGVEALLRWQNDTMGVKGPETISAAFEDWKLAAKLSERMVEAVLQDIVNWRRQGFEFGHVALNAAAAEFRGGCFAEQLLERLSAAKIPPHQIQLEVTETVFLGRGAEFVHKALETLSAAGVAIALDDFGTGYASLSHLRQFPVDIIKIDKSFVRDIGITDDARAIVGAVISLGANLNINIVAEGVETRDQERVLRRLGCAYGQGYLYSKAVPADHLASQFGRLKNRGKTASSSATRRAA